MLTIQLFDQGKNVKTKAKFGVKYILNIPIRCFSLKTINIAK